MRTVLYARVSTAEQTIAHQRAQAEAAGLRIDEVVSDEGVSGVSTRLADRPQGCRLFNLRDAGVRFVAADMPEAKEMTVGIMAVVAEGERKAISKRTTEALATMKVRFAKLKEEERADRVARGQAVKLGAVRWDYLQAGGADRGRVAGIATRQARAKGRAADLAPIIAELRASDVTTFAALAEA